MTKTNKELHKFVGFANTKQVCSSEGFSKEVAQGLCETRLVEYFHGLSDTFTRMPLEFYNGEVAYIGVYKGEK